MKRKAQQMLSEVSLFAPDWYRRVLQQFEDLDQAIITFLLHTRLWAKNYALWHARRFI